jgi:hypothetical protein
MTETEKFTFIVEKEREITEAVTIHGHKPTTVDKYAEDRKLLKRYRIDLGLIEPKASDLLVPVMDDFDKTLKTLHESTHDESIRESILKVQHFKSKTIDQVDLSENFT